MVSGIKIDLKIDPKNLAQTARATLGDPLGIPWGPLGTLWGLLGSPWGPLGTPWGALGGVWEANLEAQSVPRRQFGGPKPF